MILPCLKKARDGSSLNVAPFQHLVPHYFPAFYWLCNSAQLSGQVRMCTHTHTHAPSHTRAPHTIPASSDQRAGGPRSAYTHGTQVHATSPCQQLTIPRLLRYPSEANFPPTGVVVHVEVDMQLASVANSRPSQTHQDEFIHCCKEQQQVERTPRHPCSPCSDPNFWSPRGIIGEGR